MDKVLEIKYREFDSPSELDAQDRELVDAAIKATKSSYAPYSSFNVGAALRLEDGRIVIGSNQENAAFGHCLCAERTAMFAAGANYPGVAQRAIAIAAAQHGVLTATPASPCGACRQVMSEYQKLAGKPMKVILYSTGGCKVFESVDDILPFGFDNI